MVDIGQILTEFINQAHRADLKISRYPKTWRNWVMKVSFGQGALARIPWIALTAPDMSVSNGYYPVYHYYKDRGLLVLAFGISETHEYTETWPKKVLDQYQTIDQKLGKTHRYGSSLIFRQYHVQQGQTPVIAASTQTLTNDLENILRIYQGATQDLLSDPESDLFKGMFYMENQLEDFLIQNWQHTRLGQYFDLIFEDGEVKSQQYQTDVGPIDILARSKHGGSHTVIELKKGQTSDQTIGQVARYMGWVKKNLADPNVEGLIIAKGIDNKLEHAVSGLGIESKVSLYTYDIDFQLNSFVAS